MKRKRETYLQTLKVKCFTSCSPHFCLLGGLVGLTHLFIYLLILYNFRVDISNSTNTKEYNTIQVINEHCKRWYDAFIWASFRVTVEGIKQSIP